MNKGFSEEESILNVKLFQKESGDVNALNLKNNPNPNRTSTQLGWWLNKGYTQEEAKLHLHNRQNTASLESFIKKYGEEAGTLKYKENCKKIGYGSTVNYYIDKYGEESGILKYKEYRSKAYANYTSKESLKYLIPLYKKLRELGFSRDDIYWGIKGSKEYFLNNGMNFFFYDFTIPKIKKIIEYHGTAFHPNPNWSDDKLNEWHCVYSKLTAEEKLKMDGFKENHARNAGFDILPIWSDNLPTIETLLNFLLDNEK